MKADGIRFFISPVHGGGYLLEKMQGNKVVESFKGNSLTPDEVAKHMEEQGFSNISVLKARISDYFVRTGIKP